MRDHHLDITICNASEEIGAELESKLLATLRETLPQSNNQNFVLSAHLPDETAIDQSMIGGLTASTSYGWLLIKVLWVDSAHRRKGIGKMLLNKAELHAHELGCHNAWLDTSNPAAKTFYDAHGFNVFGNLTNSQSEIPETHQRWFMQKPLG